MTTRGAAKRPATAGRIVVGARACNACSGTPRCAVVTSAAFACWLTTLMSMTVKCKDCPDAGFAVRGHRSPAQGRSLPCRYVRSPEVTLGLAATFDHRTYRSAPVPECTDSPPAADEVFPRSGPLTTWILRDRGGVPSRCGAGGRTRITGRPDSCPEGSTVSAVARWICRRRGRAAARHPSERRDRRTPPARRERGRSAAGRLRP